MTDHIPATHPEHSYKHGHEQEVNSFDESREALKLLSKMHIIILGIPGAGKTTLCEALETQNDDINYISLGEISRNLPPESQERQELNRLFELGSPLGIPEFFCGLVEPYIDEAIDQDRGFILDGIPKKSEEILPLQQMLASKGIEIDLVVSCEISPLVAYDRVGNRSSRDGDEDTMEIFANRTAKYLQDIDTFKKQLGSDNNVPIIAINTAESSVEHATTRLIEYAQNIIKNNKQEVGERERSIQLYEAVKNNDIRTIISLIGSQFDDELPSFPHATLYENNLDEIQKHEIVADVLALKDPDLLLTPLFLKRLSKNYVNTTLMSIEHLATSLVEEVKNRYGDDFSSENVQEIMAQQLNLKKLIESLQNELVGQKNFSHHIEEEVNRNSTELEYITDIFRKHAQDLGIDVRGYDAAYFMKLQPQLWGQLTSNRVISAPDFNYRRTSNGVPGSHHSLLPFTKNNRSLSATSMGEYVPFIEAVSSTEYEYTSTFGFIHLIGKDESGEAYGVEYPIMMHDQRLLSLNSEIINEVLSTVDSFYSNHDLWHNMIPVYSDHFILHHAHAPLSYGGRMPAYVDFGKKMRQDKEEYEISVAMAHARTQQERYSADPSYRDQQTNLLRTALQRIPQLKTELADTCSQDEVQNITDYLTFMTVRRAYNVLPSTDPIFEEIDTILDSIEGLSKVSITASDIASLLWRQGLLNRESIEGIASGRSNNSSIESLLATNQAFAAESLSYINTEQEGRESGSEYIVAALDSWGAISTAKTTGSVELSKLAKARWLAIMAPQREQLRGHMEKVHGKNGITFGNTTLGDPRQLVLKQHEALQSDSAHYSYREYARIQNQQLSNNAYSLIFDDQQSTMAVQRSVLNYIRTIDEPALHLSTKKLLEDIDKLIDGLVSSDYTKYPGIDQDIADYASMLEYQQISGATQLAMTLKALASNYSELRENELRYQESIGKTYMDAEANLLNEQMTIS